MQGSLFEHADRLFQIKSNKPSSAKYKEAFAELRSSVTFSHIHPANAKTFDATLFNMAYVQRCIDDSMEGAPVATSISYDMLTGARSEHVAQMRCSLCSKALDKVQLCGRCRNASYCGVECQRAHWKVHKLGCFKSS